MLSTAMSGGTTWSSWASTGLSAFPNSTTSREKISGRCSSTTSPRSRSWLSRGPVISPGDWTLMIHWIKEWHSFLNLFQGWHVGSCDSRLCGHIPWGQYILHAFPWFYLDKFPRKKSFLQGFAKNGDDKQLPTIMTMQFQAAKMCKYTNYQKLCDLLFACFALTWVVTRLGVYPTWILYSTTIEAPQIVEMFPGNYMPFWLNWQLTCHDINWFHFIFSLLHFQRPTLHSTGAPCHLDLLYP